MQSLKHSIVTSEENIEFGTYIVCVAILKM